MIKKVFFKLWNAHDQFWFSDRSLLSLAITRILLCGSLFGLYLSRQWDIPRFYTDAGILPKAMALPVLPEFYRPYLLLAQWPDSFAPVIHMGLVVGLLLMTFGLGNRLFNFLIWLLSLAFLQRNYALAFGADLIGNLFLLLLAGTKSCERLSLKNILKTKQQALISKSDLLSNLCYRLLQIQLCIIYVYTGFEKLKGGSWWDGTALWTVLANPQMVIFDLSWMRSFSFIIVFLTFATMLFEIYFPFLVISKITRIPTLIFGLLFHVGIGFIMALWGFAIIMLSVYVLFLTEAEIKNCLKSRFFLKRLY